MDGASAAREHPTAHPNYYPDAEAAEFPHGRAMGNGGTGVGDPVFPDRQVPWTPPPPKDLIEAQDCCCCRCVCLDDDPEPS